MQSKASILGAPQTLSELEAAGLWPKGAAASHARNVFQQRDLPGGISSGGKLYTSEIEAHGVAFLVLSPEHAAVQ